MMQVQVTLTGPLAEIAAVLGRLDNGEIKNSEKLELPTGTVPSEQETKPKRHRRTKAQLESDRQLGLRAAGKEVAEIYKQDTTNADVDIDEMKDIDLGDEPETEETPAEKELGLESDIIPAFRAYADKHGRPAAGQILTKLGVKSVRDLKTAQYPGVLNMLRL